MGASGSVPLDETLGNRSTVRRDEDRRDAGSRFRCELIVIAAAAAVFLGCAISPPALMDDVDAVQAQIARNMLDSGDWVSAHLDGIAYLEKSPLKYWLIAISYKIFGVHDWVARLPVALSAVILCWLVFRIGSWAFSARAGMYAGLALATSVGLFLFTRIQIPDVTITATIALAMWSFLRALDSEEPRPGLWAIVMAAAIGTGLLLKGLIAAVFPVASGLLYLALTRQLLIRKTWQRLRPFSGILVFLAIAAPWHILATLRNPPYFDFTMHSERGSYHGFFWFYFMNEHVLRFLNLRYPRDYNTVPRLAFWLQNLLWLFPWSAYLPATVQLSYKPVDRAGRTRLLALCWAGFLLVFFTLSTTQEYYSMPMYPALALLLGCAMDNEGEAGGGNLITAGSRTIAVISAAAAVAIAAILFQVRNVPAVGDISRALQQQQLESYTLSLGHMGDLTLQSFAYLRAPLILAGIAFLVGAVGGWLKDRRAFLALAAMMILFLHASRMALVVFDPYLSSRPLADALLQAPEGQLIVDGPYYPFSSVLFYSNKRALLLNGRINNLEYGSYAPGAPHVFIDDAEFVKVWSKMRCYLVADRSAVA